MVGAASYVGPPLPRVGSGYFTANLTVVAGNTEEVVYGLGQGNWTDEGGCPARGLAGSRIVPLERNGQKVRFQQRPLRCALLAPYTVRYQPYYCVHC